MPLIRRRPAGHTVRLFGLPLDPLNAHDKKTKAFVEAYHYRPLSHCKKVVRLEALVPDGETLSNPRYIDVEDCLDIPRRSIKVHDCRVVIGANMYLVTGYWYRYSDVNRSVKTATGLTWKGEIVVVKAGRSIPYLKRVKHTRQADIAMSKYVVPRSLVGRIGCSLEVTPRFILKFKLCLSVKKRFPTMIVA